MLYPYIYIYAFGKPKMGSFILFTRYYYDNQIKERERWMETRNASRVLVRKPEGKRQLVDIGKDGRIVLNVFLN
jgi:hypothetical protein